MEGLLSEKTKLVLEKIIQHCFYINRMADRMVSVLSVKFVMLRKSDIRDSPIKIIFICSWK